MNRPDWYTRKYIGRQRKKALHKKIRRTADLPNGSWCNRIDRTKDRPKKSPVLPEEHSWFDAFMAIFGFVRMVR